MKTLIRAGLLILLLGTISQAAHAGTVNIDFEGGTDETPVGSFYASEGITFPNASFKFFETDIAIFHSIARSQPLPQDPIVGVFSSPVSFVSIWAEDVGGDGARIDAFDAAVGGNLIAWDLTTGNPANPGGLGERFLISVSAPGIMRIQLDQPFHGTVPEGVLFDDLTFGTPGSTVPLPSAAWAGLGLLGLIGAVRRYRRRKAA